MSVIFQVLKAEDNVLNRFVADEDKKGDQIIATLEFEGEQFNGMGDTKDAALEDLCDKVSAYFNAQKNNALLEVNKALGQYFFD